MISVQELGISILGGTPSKLYFIGGSEIGVKDEYLSSLHSHYGIKADYPKLLDIINMMSSKHLIPLKPSLYIVRYDESLISELNDKVAEKIKSCNIVGTIVCIYSDPKHISKVDKFFPECTAIIDPVRPDLVCKYLHRDFPKLDDRSIKVAACAGSSYGHSRNICYSMSFTSPKELNMMTEDALVSLFGCRQVSTEKELQLAVASKNFRAMTSALDKIDSSSDTLHYVILQTMIEMEKVLTSKYSDSPIRPYAKYWTLQDVFFMFMLTYAELEKLRSISTDSISSLVFLFGVAAFQHIPSPEVFEYGV